MNFAPGVPGVGLDRRPSAGGRRCRSRVVNLIGRVFMAPADCPFQAVEEIAAERCVARRAVIFVDMHGEATSEKVGMGWYLDGRCRRVVGSHTHVQTADERVLPGGHGVPDRRRHVRPGATR